MLIKKMSMSTKSFINLALKFLSQLFDQGIKIVKIICLGPLKVIIKLSKNHSSNLIETLYINVSL